MNIGDRVRLLHGKEEGIIRKISSSGRLEIEIEDGFIIPALKSEAVLIHSAEQSYFGKQSDPEPTLSQSQPLSTKATAQGFFLAFVPINDRQLSLYLINTSTEEYLGHVMEVFGTNQRTLFAARISAGQFLKFDERILQELDQWPMFYFQLIPIQHKLSPEKKAFERKIKLKATQFFKLQATAPLLDKKAFLLQLDNQFKELDIEKLNESLQSLRPGKEKTTFSLPESRVDLHLEALKINPEDHNQSELLGMQLAHFEQKLNQAIVSGMDEITFVHGIGNGVLRKEIHKRLSQLKNIKYFKDTQKDQWGYGATLVQIS